MASACLLTTKHVLKNRFIEEGNMTVMTDTEYIDAVQELVTQVQDEFLPFALPNEDGDCIEFFVSQKDYYAKRIDDYLTLYLEEGTDVIAGFVIKNITRILQRVSTQQAAHSFVIWDGEIRIEALFTARFLGDECRGTYVREYHMVADIAKQYHLDRVRIPSIFEKTHTTNVHETLGV